MKKNKTTKLCCIFNFAAHYRLSIYQLIDQKLKADFYIGDSSGNLKRMDYNSLKGYRRTLKNHRLFGSVTWQSGAISLPFKSYNNYLITGDFQCLSTWIVLLFCKILGKKTYLWTHGWYGREGWVKRQVKSLYFCLSTGIFLYGEYAKEQMTKAGFKENKLFVIANSLDYDKQLQIRKKLQHTNVYRNHFINDFPNLIFVGRLTKVKRIDMILDAMKILQNDKLFVNLTLVGGEMPEFNMRKAITERGLNDFVWLYGSCYDEQKIGELLFNATVCVSPGNVGLTAIHSLSFGCPVITHNDFPKQMPEFEAIEDGVNGMFFNYNDVFSLSETIKKWIDQTNSKVRDMDVHSCCYRIIDEKFNPYYQIEILDKVIMKQ